MRMKLISSCFVFFLCVFAPLRLCVEVSASTADISALSFSSLIRSSDLVVVGEVTRVYAVPRGTANVIKVEETIKNARGAHGNASLGDHSAIANGEVVVRTGKRGQGGLEYQQGERVLVFLTKRRGLKSYFTTYNWFGKIPLIEETEQEFINAAREHVIVGEAVSGQGVAALSRGQREHGQDARIYKNMLVKYAMGKNFRLCVSACVDIIRDKKIAELLATADVNGLSVRLLSAERWSPDLNYIVEVLGASKSSQAVVPLVGILSKPYGKYLGVSVARALEQIADPEAERLLIDKMSDPEPYVRSNVLYVLSRVASTEGTNALLNASGSEGDRNVRREAVASLGLLKDRQAARTGLAAAASDADPIIRRLATDMLSQLR